MTEDQTDIQTDNAASTAALAIQSLPTLLGLGGSFFPKNGYQVLTTVNNWTGHLLEPLNYITPHGKLLALQTLPVIPPAASGGAPRPHCFPASYFVGGRDHALQAPAVLAQWKMADKNLYLMIFIYAAGGSSSHGGYFGLTAKPVDLNAHWKNARQDRDWYYAGEVARNCDKTVGGVRITGSLSNNDPGSMEVNLHPV